MIKSFSITMNRMENSGKETSMGEAMTLNPTSYFSNGMSMIKLISNGAQSSTCEFFLEV
jgi:hypothetical protein